MHIGQRQREVFIADRNVFRQIRQAHEDGLQRILHLVRHTGRQGPDRFHFLGLDQLQLGRLQLLMRCLEVRQRLS